MLYIGIDLHLKQLTVCVRNEQGDVTLRRQVSTRPHKVREFLDELRMLDGGYVAILEVCGFHDWWHMLRKNEPYCYGGVPQRTRPAPGELSEAQREQQRREVLEDFTRAASRGAATAAHGTASESTGSSSLCPMPEETASCPA